MSCDTPKVTIHHAPSHDWQSDGRRGFFEYCDLGVRKASDGRYLAQLIRSTGVVEPPIAGHMHTLELQMVYMLKGWMTLWHEGQGEVTLRAGDCMYQPGGSRHGVVDWSPDFELLEVTSPADFGTIETDEPSAA